MDEKRIARISVTWRGRDLDVDADPSCTVKEFGQLLLDLTSVKPETLKLIVPQSTHKGSKLIMPFSGSHSGLTLKEAAISEGKPIRMMGVFDDEIEEVSDNGRRPDMRIIGFDQEERRLRQRSSGRPQVPLKLPQGQYIFCDFRTLQLPGIELNPPPSEALKRMHMLACDPGIIAIMKKHRWRVGIMTEMAPVGYVGVSPKCILGFNKNMGEEISLRLRTDDLKGFRKYESIKKTLLHELAHMVHSEHDANFFALNKQLNEEAASLDWTKSSGHVLSGRKIFDPYEDEFVLEPEAGVVGHKLGGGSSSLASARVLSGAAAYQRLLNASSTDLESSHNRVNTSAKIGNVQGTQIEPDPDDDGQDFVQANMKVEPDPDDNDAMHVDAAIATSGSPGFISLTEQNMIGYSEPDPDYFGKKSFVGCLEPDPDDSSDVDTLKEMKIDGKHHKEPDPDDCASEFVLESGNKMAMETELRPNTTVLKSEPDPDYFGKKSFVGCLEPDPDDSSDVDTLKEMKIDGKHHKEPDPDDRASEFVLESGNKMAVETELRPNTTVLKSEPDPDDSSDVDTLKEMKIDGKNHKEPDPDDRASEFVLESGNKMAVETKLRPNTTVLKSEPDPDYFGKKSFVGCLEPDPDDSSDVDTLKEMKIDGKHHKEPDPDDRASEFVLESGNKMAVETELRPNTTVLKSEPDPDDSSNAILDQEVSIDGKHVGVGEPDPDDTTCGGILESGSKMEVETGQSRNSSILKSEPDPDDHAIDSKINELQRIEEPVAALCSRLQKAIEMLRLQATPSEAASVLQTLFKIIKNVIESPNDIRYRRLRKSNPHFQRSVANYKAAMEVLELIGFCEDIVSDEIGRAETYLVLKRNDPGLLWLAKSSLEVSMA